MWAALALRPGFRTVASPDTTSTAVFTLTTQESDVLVRAHVLQKAHSHSRAADPRFDSRFLRGDFPGRVIPET